MKHINTQKRFYKCFSYKWTITDKFFSQVKIEHE